MASKCSCCSVLSIDFVSTPDVRLAVQVCVCVCAMWVICALVLLFPSSARLPHFLVFLVSSSLSSLVVSVP